MCAEAQQKWEDTSGPAMTALGNAIPYSGMMLKKNTIQVDQMHRLKLFLQVFLICNFLIESAFQGIT